MPLLRLFLISWLSVAAYSLRAETIRIGAEDDAAPWSYADGTGYVNDLVRAAFNAVNWRVDYDVQPYPRCKMLASAGKQSACFSVSHTPDLNQTLLFPDEPVFIAKNILFARPDSILQGCSADNWPKNTSVGLVNGYEYQAEGEALRQDKRVKIDMTRSEALNLRKLAAGRIDAALITIDSIHNLEFMALLANVKPNFKPICDYGGAPAYIAFSKSHPLGLAGLNAFNKGMAMIIKNGTKAQLEKEWSSHALSIEGAKAR